MKKSIFPLARQVLLPIAAICSGFSGARAQVPDEVTQNPNIVFILADDLGWMDLGCYGSYSYQTPNIDRLATQGMRFTQAYAYPTCSPTRASLMTGMDPARLGITMPACHLPEVILQPTVPAKAPNWMKLIPPTVTTRVDTKYVTYAELLKQAGYVTGHFGKWHLGREPYSALQQGFDVDIPHTDLSGPGGSYLAPWNKTITRGLTLPYTKGKHLETQLAEEASAFIEKNKDRPFLLNYWAFSVHEPLTAKPSDIQKYAHLADSYSPQRNPVYAAMVKSLDDAVGTLLATLEKNGLAEKTIVIFMSDNGGVIGWPGGLPPQYRGIPPTSNVPLRMGKNSAYEGGPRVPLIVRWPGVVKPGTVSKALVASMDLYPTFAQIGGAKLSSGQLLDGTSLIPVLRGSKSSVRNSFYVIVPQYNPRNAPNIEPPRAAVWSGEWKLLRLFGEKADGTDRYELYNLKDDVGETYDMSAAVPEIAQTLAKKLNDHIARIHVVLPEPNPDYDPHAVYVYKRQPSQPVVPPPDNDVQE